jgi:4-amino-4-deoxy-L-arabinose transferase-like glycosyltransferase
MFNSKVGIYSAVLFSIVPINLLWGFRISTEIYGLFFLLLSFLFFWKGFEEKHNLSKILFGIFLGLALLTRYTTMWIIPLFLIYFLIRDKNLKFLRDKYLWFSILTFFVVLIPWFVYGMVFYSNPLGAFIHGTIGASFWGGIQSGFFYFIYFWRNFSLIGIGFVVSLIYFCNKKLLKDKQIHFLLIWFLLIFLIASFMPHKEERFILILVPSLCLLLGVFINKIDEKILKWFNKNRFLGFVLLIFCFLIVLFPVFLNFYSEESTGTSYCFSKGLNFIKHLNDNALIYSDETPIVYAYTDKCTRFYPNPWNVTYLERGENNFIIYTDYDRPLYLEENVLFREELSNNFELVFSCDEDWGITEVYKIGN